VRAQVSHIKTHGQVKSRRQQAEGWGAKVMDRLSADLRLDFPDMRGLSPRNLKYMWAFAAACLDRAIVQQVAAQIPWFHISYSKQSIRLSLDIPLTPCYPPHHGAQGCAPNVSYHEIAGRHY
jgi:hypothetical protein